MRSLSLRIALVAAAFVAVGSALAEDNTLTEAEKADGWQLLFNGKDYDGWSCNNKKPIASKIEDGALQPHQSGGYIIVHEKQFGDFVLKCDVKLSAPHCNSGVFLRVSNRYNPVYTGLEVQVENNDDGGSPLHRFGAIYDLVPAAAKAAKPAGEWNALEITCKGPQITVTLNGREVSRINCDEFAERGKRPDGSRHKFGVAIKDMKRVGYIGFQDHGQPVWFKNVKIKELSSS